ncbi:hypothetical protein LO80_01410 [Candidatus Francisella endociliophora]|uniref:Uncharacterized protein n=1 Tax=Candidatus Francisella endociliophora TaxID=653937 RepID=A0A097EMG5_9GAMM|nr:WD40 repeat domain-containing protein [Francisella sp. FSC1006]AIT08762.1 hypothetical protein LO80_01410 [Francisella sp. FSC1006]
MSIFKKIICILGLSTSTSLVFAVPTALSVSTDGEYAVSSNNDGNVYLYNLNKKTIKKINYKTVNVFSANFINDTHDFIYQTFDDNVVHIIDADNLKTIKSFTGQKNSVMQTVNKDLNTYAFATRGGNMNIAKIKDNKLGSTYSYGNQFMAMSSNLVPTFYKNKLVTATGNGSLLIFNINEIFKKANKNNPKNQIDIHKNSGSVMSAIDPNGKFVYTVDSMGKGVKYNLVDNSNIKYGMLKRYIKNNVPKNTTNAITNFKYIDNNQVIATYKGIKQPYLWLSLYNISDFKQWESSKGHSDWTQYYITPIASLPLVDNPKDYLDGNYITGADAKPYPSTSGYNTTFDTSVEAHKLVMAQANGNGIMVYNYNPSDESLKLDWVAEPPKAEEKKEESKGWFGW